MRAEEGSALNVPVTPTAIGAFLCLLGLCYQAHELAHHVFGGIACGRLGTVDFSTFSVVDGCALAPDLATELFGPAVSLVIAYVAATRLRRRPSLLAFACLFASYFHLRWLPPLLGGGDELDVARKLGFDHAWLIAALLFAIGSVPVAIAWRAVAARGRWRTCLAYLLPLPFLFGVDRIAALISGNDALIPELARIEVLNIPLTVLLADLILAIGLAVMGRRVRHRHGPQGRGA